MAVPACNLTAVRARELRVDGLARYEAFYLGDGRTAVQLGADDVVQGGRKGSSRSKSCSQACSGADAFHPPDRSAASIPAALVALCPAARP